MLIDAIIVKEVKNFDNKKLHTFSSIPSKVLKKASGLYNSFLLYFETMK